VGIAALVVQMQVSIVLSAWIGTPVSEDFAWQEFVRATLWGTSNA
jgi:hypothetical protein